MGAHAVACDATDGVGGVEEGGNGLTMKRGQRGGL
jgi:hypothetical protein